MLRVLTGTASQGCREMDGAGICRLEKSPGQQPREKEQVLINPELILLDSCWIQALQTRPCVPGDQYCRAITHPGDVGEELLQELKGPAKFPEVLFLKPSSSSTSVLGGKDSPRFLASGIARWIRIIILSIIEIILSITGTHTQ